MGIVCVIVVLCQYVIVSYHPTRGVNSCCLTPGLQVTVTHQGCTNIWVVTGTLSLRMPSANSVYSYGTCMIVTSYRRRIISSSGTLCVQLGLGSTPTICSSLFSQNSLSPARKSRILLGSLGEGGWTVGSASAIACLVWCCVVSVCSHIQSLHVYKYTQYDEQTKRNILQKRLF